MARSGRNRLTRAIFALVAAALLSGAAAGCARWRPSGFKPTAGPPAFRLLLEHDRYVQDGPIILRLELANTSHAPVLVNRRMFVNASSAPQTDREVLLEVTDQLGRRLEVKLAQETGLPKTEDYVWLQPGEAVIADRVWDLRELVGLDAPGRYTVQGRYHNVMGAELGLSVFSQPVRSEAVTLRVDEQ